MEDDVDRQRKDIIFVFVLIVFHCCLLYFYLSWYLSWDGRWCLWAEERQSCCCSPRRCCSGFEDISAGNVVMVIKMIIMTSLKKKISLRVWKILTWKFNNSEENNSQYWSFERNSIKLFPPVLGSRQYHHWQLGHYHKHIMIFIIVIFMAKKCSIIIDF